MSHRKRNIDSSPTRYKGTQRHHVVPKHRKKGVKSGRQNKPTQEAKQRTKAGKNGIDCPNQPLRIQRKPFISCHKHISMLLNGINDHLKANYIHIYDKNKTSPGRSGKKVPSSSIIYPSNPHIYQLNFLSYILILSNKMLINNKHDIIPEKKGIEVFFTWN